MTKRRHRLLLEALERVQALTGILNDDLIRSFHLLKAIADEQDEEDVDVWRVAFGIKTVIRSFFGQVDGISNAMRLSAADLGPELGAEISESQLLKLRAERKRHDGEVVPQRLAPDESLKLGFRFFPRLFGTSSSLDTDAPQWLEFLELKKVRNAISHPEKFDDLTAINGLSRIRPCTTWFGREMRRILAECEEGLLGESQLSDLPDTPSFEPPEVIEPLFESEEYERIRHSTVASYAYFEKAKLGITSETSSAFSLATSEEPMSPAGQFALRTLVRTLDSDVQGTTELIKFFLTSAEERDEIHLSDHEKAQLDSKAPLSDQIVFTVNLWSEKFGHERTVKKRGKDWLAFKKTRVLRNKIIHPKRPSDLRLDPDDLDTVLGAIGWYLTTMDALQFDTAKLPAEPQ